MGALEDLTRQLREVAGDEGLDPGAKAASLRVIRERVADVVGYADRLIAAQRRRQEGEASAGLRARMGARARATLGEAVHDDGLEEAGVLSHRTLDELEEEGLLLEALGRLAEEGVGADAGLEIG